MTEEQVDTQLIAAGLNLLADATTARVVAGLREAGLDCILLKGRAHRGWIDNDPTRLSGDIDLLVDPDELSRVEEVLANLGFERQGSLDVLPGDRPYHASNWSAQDGIEIDLHRHIIGVGVAPHDAWIRLSASTEQQEIGGTPVAILSPAARTMHLALHAAQHGVGEKRTLRDLELGLEVLPPSLWLEASELASSLDAHAAFAAALRLTPRGHRLADQLGLGSETTLEVALRASSPPPMTAGFEWLSTMPGTSQRMRFVLHKLVPPPEWMRAWKPLARRGNSGLAIAYVWRPFWLVGHAVPAYRAWRRVRRAAR